MVAKTAKPEKEKSNVARSRSLERACDKAIINSLKYRAVFNASVSNYQLSTFLIAPKRVSQRAYKNRLKNLIRAKKIKEKKSKYYYPKIKPVSWPLRKKYSEEHLESVDTAFDILKTIKWIKLLAVSGSVAACSAKKKDDVDIFIVTERNRVWLTRFFVVVLLKIIGKYRTDEDYNHKICPNIYVDEKSTAWPKNQRNVYIAHEILMMHPIINRDDAYFKFIGNNDWAFDYFANYRVHLPKETGRSTKYESHLVDFFEHVFMNFQLWYMRKKKTTEVTSKNIIHFNREDHTEEILKKYKRLVSTK